MGWASLLYKVVTLADVPEPITLGRYERLIDEQVHGAMATVDAELFRASVVEGRDRVKRLGTDRQYLPRSEASWPSATQAFGIAGQFVTAQVDHDRHGWSDAGQLDLSQWGASPAMSWLVTPASAVAGLMPPGVAVVITREEVPL